MTKAIIFILSAFASLAHSYPQYIKYGYQSCAGCHYNPYGNGPLTDYGRVVGATIVAANNLGISESENAKRSSFSFGLSKNKWLRPSINYRGLQIQANGSSRFVPMDISASVVTKWLTKGKLTTVAQLAFNPKPTAVPHEYTFEPTSREMYIGYRPHKSVGLYFGLMDKIYGIRVPEHTAFSRSTNKLTQHDQVISLMTNLSTKNFEFGVQSFNSGFAAQAEAGIGKYQRYGTSLLYEGGVLTSAVHARIGIKKKYSALIEAGQTISTTPSRYLFFQNEYTFFRGLSGLATIEAYDRNWDDPYDALNRISFGFIAFPIQRVELRVESFKTYFQGKASESLMSQLHFWI